MGSTRFRSWSYSRQRLFKTCKRAFFYQYYWKGEPNQDVLWELRRVKSIPLLVGDLAHEAIAVALRQWVQSHVQAKNLFDIAGKQYEQTMRASLRAALAMRAGRRPPGKWPILQHHLELGKRSDCEEIGLETLRDHLVAFETSEAWQFLRDKKTYTQLWEPITSSSDDKPSFVAMPTLGFERAAGVRIYTAFDLALTYRSEFVIVDWKAARKSDEAVAQVRKQLTSYCLWALAGKKATRASLRIQPYFLQSGEKWSPVPVWKEDFFNVVRDIEDHVGAEMSLVRVCTDENGEGIEYIAEAEDFPAEPRQGVCASCKFLTACKEGKAVLKGQ
jgi:hypothetical protein